MSGGPSSARFAAIYESLPPDVQTAIIEKQLIPLLDHVPKSKSRRVLASAAKMQRRHAGIPVIDLKAKQREVNALLDELHRDSKRAFVKERSRRTELIEQTVESVTTWLNDIWSLVYEHNVDFMLAHRCLHFIVNVLDQVAHGRASCRCAFSGMYVPITIKAKSGRVVKSWELNGAHHIEEVLQFIWRDLFLSLLAFGSQRQIKKIPEMLDDIEDLMGWNALQRILYGGRKCEHDSDEDPDADPFAYETESDIDEDEDAYTDDDSELDGPIAHTDWLPKRPTKGSPARAKHWSPRIAAQVPRFRRHVLTALTAVFHGAPSLALYTALLGESPDPDGTSRALLLYLSQMATSCPDVFAAALDIHARENNTDALAGLLASHAHLVRPRDVPALQAAAACLAADPAHHARALALLEAELLDTARCVHAALRGPFALLDAPENRAEIEQIVRLRTAAPGRQDRVERWVDAVCTPGLHAPNPMALAAMVMGLPIVPALDGTEDADPLGYLDLDPSDPDMEDLRDEFRPRLKQRFEGWTDTAIRMKGGAAVLLKVYREVVQMMPFLRAGDVVEDLLGRLADKPSKQYLVDAVDALSAFVKVQRRKVALAKTEQKRRAAAEASASAAGPSASSSSSTPASGSSSTGTTPPAASTYAAPTVAEADMDEAGSRPETPPPPLEPAAPPPAPLFTFYTGHISMPPPPGGGGGAPGPGPGPGPGAQGGGGGGAGGLFGGAFGQMFGGGFGAGGGGFGGMEDVD
ncbi:hypothetical protein OH77DRAFT_1513254 [Trametes cingulata]|nr:hypothetical protein OH77DRAFT_1513254 [Trametes cingulata]